MEPSFLLFIIQAHSGTSIREYSQTITSGRGTCNWRGDRKSTRNRWRSWSECTNTVGKRTDTVREDYRSIFRYSLNGTDDFTIDEETGILRTSKIIDRETTDRYDIVVRHFLLLSYLLLFLSDHSKRWRRSSPLNYLSIDYHSERCEW